MGTRGRKSSAELAVIGSTGVVQVRRPPAPPELTQEQADEWRAIVNASPADRFPREVHPLLSAYCRHIVALRHIGQLVSQSESGEQLDEKVYDKRLAMQERESRCIASIAVRLGLAKSGVYEHKKPQNERPPWLDPDKG